MEYPTNIVNEYLSKAIDDLRVAKAEVMDDRIKAEIGYLITMTKLLLPKEAQ